MPTWDFCNDCGELTEVSIHDCGSKSDVQPLVSLRPCPFCKEPMATMEKQKQFHLSSWYVACWNCCARGPKESTEDEARAGWNDSAS